jgi:hypothetical protein
MRLNINIKPVSAKDLINIADKESIDLEKTWNVKVLVMNNFVGIENYFVNCDLVFMSFVLAELMLNAVKSVERWRKRLEEERELEELLGSSVNDSGEIYDGKVKVIFVVKDGCFQCIISDNGSACFDDEEKKKFLDSYIKALDDPFRPYLVQLGLPFCVIATRHQRGQIFYETNQFSTSVTVQLEVP